MYLGAAPQPHERLEVLPRALATAAPMPTGRHRCQHQQPVLKASDSCLPQAVFFFLFLIFFFFRKVSTEIAQLSLKNEVMEKIHI